MQQVQPSDVETDRLPDMPMLQHIYSHPLSRGIKIGDVAYCGHVKRLPPIGSEAASKLPMCPPCDAIKMLGLPHPKNY